MKERNIAAAVIHEVDKYYFQYRDGPKQKGALGKTGLFGGKLKPGESFREAAYREVVKEEVAITPEPSPEQFRLLDQFKMVTTEKLLRIFRKKTLNNIEVFQLMLPFGSSVEAKEGTLIALRGEDQVVQADGAFSPIAKVAMRRLFEYEPEHY